MRIVRTVPPDAVVAILTSDIHLSMNPPIARAEEPNWFRAMGRSIKELHRLAEDLHAPILCAGDIFDKWQSPPEVINWAIEHMPIMYAIAGNHDLPHHRPELVHRSAYGTLVRAGKIIEIDEKKRSIGNLEVYGRVLGEDVPAIEGHGDMLRVLLTHEYMWVEGAGHVGASEDQKVTTDWSKKFADFDVVVVGDNHHGFQRKINDGNCTIFNCGALMRRRSNEADYEPRVGLLHASGKVTSHPLDTSRDVLTRTVTEEQEREDDEDDEVASSFVEELQKLEASRFSFREAIMRAMDKQKVDNKVRKIILVAMGE